MRRKKLLHTNNFLDLQIHFFLGGEVKFEAQGGAYMVLIFLAILKLAVLIEVVLIKKKRVIDLEEHRIEFKRIKCVFVRSNVFFENRICFRNIKCFF